MRRAPAAVVTASHLNHMHVFPTRTSSVPSSLSLRPCLQTSPSAARTFVWARHTNQTCEWIMSRLTWALARCWPACFECFCQLKDNLRDWKIQQWSVSHTRIREGKLQHSHYWNTTQAACTHTPLQSMHRKHTISTRKCNKAMMHVQGAEL